ncbi:uncharacterized protein V6R79_006167 [Siganus canaliculatus]
MHMNTPMLYSTRKVYIRVELLCIGESQEDCNSLSVCCEVSQMGDNIFTSGKSTGRKQNGPAKLRYRIQKSRLLRSQRTNIIMIHLPSFKCEVLDVYSFGNLHLFEKKIEVKNLLNELAATRILLLHRPLYLKEYGSQKPIKVLEGQSGLSAALTVHSASTEGTGRAVNTQTQAVCELNRNQVAITELLRKVDNNVEKLSASQVEWIHHIRRN